MQLPVSWKSLGAGMMKPNQVIKSWGFPVVMGEKPLGPNHSVVMDDHDLVNRLTHGDDWGSPWLQKPTHDMAPFWVFYRDQDDYRDEETHQQPGIPLLFIP